MDNLTSRERIRLLLQRKPVDRIGAFEHFWPETIEKWKPHLSGQDPWDHFKLDIRFSKLVNVVADIYKKEELIDEAQDWKLVRDGNGALLKWMKNVSSTPEHVDFAIKTRDDWEGEIKPLLTNQKIFMDRIDFKSHLEIKNKCSKENLFYCWNSINVFECMHPICGHENLLMGMVLDPDWVKDMTVCYSNLLISAMEEVCGKQGAPDGVFFYEDLGFKAKPFMSPQMYKDIIWPAHKKIFDYVHSIGAGVILHSCGYVEPLVPLFIEAGIDCLQAIEIKAGMDLIKLAKQYGKEIAFMGGIDVRPLTLNNKGDVLRELESKINFLKENGSFILHSDHSIPPQVEYETYKYFLKQGLNLGSY